MDSVATSSPSSSSAVPSVKIEHHRRAGHSERGNIAFDRMCLYLGANHLGSVCKHAAGLLVLGPFRRGPHVGRSRFAKGFLIVPDIEAAGDQLVAAGVEVGEFFHDGPEGRGRPASAASQLSFARLIE